MPSWKPPWLYPIGPIGIPRISPKASHRSPRDPRDILDILDIICIPSVQYALQVAEGFGAGEAHIRRGTLRSVAMALAPWPPRRRVPAWQQEAGTLLRGRADRDRDGRDEVRVGSTLFRDKAGSLEQKLMTLFVCQVDEKGKPGNMVGGLTFSTL